MFRDYTNVNINVKNNYKNARQFQTLNFVKYMNDKYNKFINSISINDALDALNNFIDLSDPDTELPNLEHLYQSAQAALDNNEPEWLIITCLIHDLGKIIYLKGCDSDGTSITEQYGIVGDTFIVGCKIPDSIIFPEYNNLNSDMQTILYNTKNGIYESNCGLDNCHISYGHDEYLYQLLKFNNINLPNEALYIIRYHSLYLHHCENAYEHLLNDKDIELLPLLKKFNTYDLYSKNPKKISKENKEYFNNLLHKYFPHNIYY